MEAYTKANPDVRLFRIDIDSWQSPVAAQHEIRSLPSLHLYEDGELVSQDTRQVLTRLR